MDNKPKMIPDFDSEKAHSAVVMEDEAKCICDAFTIANLEDMIDHINEELKAIRTDRGKRYGHPKDTLKNVRDCDPEGAWRGAYVSATECLNRLRNMFFKPMAEIDMKDFENATDDLINYAYYIKILGRQA